MVEQELVCLENKMLSESMQHVGLGQMSTAEGCIETWTSYTRVRPWAWRKMRGWLQGMKVLVGSLEQEHAAWPRDPDVSKGFWCEGGWLRTWCGGTCAWVRCWWWNSVTSVYLCLHRAALKRSQYTYKKRWAFSSRVACISFLFA